MTETIDILTTSGNGSRIIVGDAISGLDALIGERRAIVITDAAVHRHYGPLVDRYEHIIMGMGETNKTLITADRIYRELMAAGADRTTFLLGIGGGIVTDMTGFVASTYMRGLSFGFVSTTLLGQIDASVGGKNGVNLDGYKNMVGTFNQPEFVLSDTAMLRTLSLREFRSGVAEAVKAAVIADAELFDMIAGHGTEEIRENTQLLTKIITRAIRVKGAIVAHDERESGERRKLNLGHTFAHAIEAIDTRWLHGEAVAAGLAMATDISLKLGAIDPAAAQKIKEALENAGLPATVDTDRNRILKAVRSDKKAQGDTIFLVLPTGIGSCEVRQIEFAELENLL